MDSMEMGQGTAFALVAIGVSMLVLTLPWLMVRIAKPLLARRQRSGAAARASSSGPARPDLELAAPDAETVILDLPDLEFEEDDFENATTRVHTAPRLQGLTLSGAPIPPAD